MQCMRLVQEHSALQAHTLDSFQSTHSQRQPNSTLQPGAEKILVFFFLYSSKFAFYIYFFSEGLVIELTVHKFHWSQAVTQSICSRFDTSTASKRYKSCSGYKLIDFIDFPQSCDNDISLLNLVEQTAFPICQCEHENQFTALFRRLSHQKNKYSQRKQTTDTGLWHPLMYDSFPRCPFPTLSTLGCQTRARRLQLSQWFLPRMPSINY